MRLSLSRICKAPWLPFRAALVPLRVKLEPADENTVATLGLSEGDPFHLPDEGVRVGQGRAGGEFDVDLEVAAVGLREQFRADLGDQQEAQTAVTPRADRTTTARWRIAQPSPRRYE